MKFRVTCVGAVLFAFAVICNADSNEELDSDEFGQAPGSVPTTCSCGWTNKVQSRIVGGVETQINEFPFMAGLAEVDQMFIYCGATLIGPRHVLTAAHCVRGKRPDNLGVYVGEHDVFSGTETKATEFIKVKEVIEHPDYETTHQKNDIAVLVLERDADFSARLVGPACLPSANVDLVGEFVRVLGWGHMKHRGKQSKVLRKVNIKVVPLKNCADTFPEGAVPLTDPKQICTFSPRKDACKGDSGGPVIWLDPETNMYTLVGIVSYGAECGKDDPAVQTNVASYMEWISSTVAKSSSGSKVCTKASSVTRNMDVSEYAIIHLIG